MTATEVTIADLAAEVQRLKDRQAIVDRLYAYPFALDHADIELWLDTFTEDGVWIVSLVEGGDPVIDLHGRDALRAFIEDVAAKEPSGMNHATVNPRVLSLDGDEATATAYYTAATLKDDVITATSIGRYHDTLVRCPDGQWRIKVRKGHRRVVYTQQQA